MAEPTRRRRGHAASSARIFTAGLSSAAAFGMVAGMAVTAARHEKEPSEPAALSVDTSLVPSAVPPASTPPAAVPSEVVVVIRRHWIAPASEPGTVSAPTTPAPAPLLVTTPARPAPVAAPAPTPRAAPRPAARPVTRTRGS